MPHQCQYDSSKNLWEDVTVSSNVVWWHAFDKYTDLLRQSSFGQIKTHFSLFSKCVEHTTTSGMSRYCCRIWHVLPHFGYCTQRIRFKQRTVPPLVGYVSQGQGTVKHRWALIPNYLNVLIALILFFAGKQKCTIAVAVQKPVRKKRKMLPLLKIVSWLFIP